jgi:hypothetical protein
MSPALLLLQKPGAVEVTATQAATADYNAATAKQTISVSNIITAVEDPYTTLTIYPNPTRGTLILENSDVEKISLVDMRGVVVQEWKIGVTATLDLKEVSPGLYLLTGVRGNTVVFRKKLIRE